MTTSKPGIVRYMAPELLDPSQFGLETNTPSKESDVYSLAVTSFEVRASYIVAHVVGKCFLVQILSEVLPHGGGRDSAVAFAIVTGNRPPRPNNLTASRWLPDEIWDSIQLCWDPIPGTRPPIGLLRRAFAESESRDTPIVENGQHNLMIH
jgi:serine/threonine protein kinase